MTKTKLFLAILSVGLLALGGMATAVVAEDDDDGSDSPRSKAQERREEMREKAANRTAGDSDDHRDGNRSAERMDRHERMRAAHDAWQDCKREAVAANASVPESCGDEKAFFLNATHARREGHALIGAIAALERQIGRLEAREIALEDKLEAGNLTANETARLEAKIAKIDSVQERLADKLEKLKARLAALHEKWQSVRDEADESDDEDEQEDDGSSSSSSSSASESSSSSSSSSASESPSESSSSSESSTSSAP